MQKIVSLLLSAILVFTACNDSSESKAISKDSIHKAATDSPNYNPSALPVQNSDDPNRFSQ